MSRCTYLDDYGEVVQVVELPRNIWTRVRISRGGILVLLFIGVTTLTYTYIKKLLQRDSSLRTWDSDFSAHANRVSEVESLDILSTLVENSPLRKISTKKFYSRITWLGTFCRGGKFSTFGGKFSTLVKFVFRHLDLRVSQFASQMEDVENFPPKVENFPLQKNFLEKKIFIPKSHELEHSAEVEIFPLLVEKFPLWRNFVFGFWTLAFATFEPKYAKWKFFHFGGKFSTFKNFFFLQNCKNWVILHRKVFSEKSEIFPLFPLTRKFRKFIYPGL